ncbi:hypothetical protein [Paraburkholderia ginsengiterrae]|uniref:hypothetical protein n=1 Tax=Paraburkholderia ginsengiterrae TaxID=1462993 RepID=UPI001041F858|nr:hypothetical protein [Paraburkholderia ginsengiterrae]
MKKDSPSWFATADLTLRVNRGAGFQVIASTRECLERGVVGIDEGHAGVAFFLRLTFFSQNIGANRR